MFKLFESQIADLWAMQKKACHIDHEHFYEEPLIPRAGNWYSLVVVDEEGSPVSYKYTVKVYECTEYQVCMEIVEGVKIYNDEN